VNQDELDAYVQAAVARALQQRSRAAAQLQEQQNEQEQQGRTLGSAAALRNKGSSQVHKPLAAVTSTATLTDHFLRFVCALASPAFNR
jgi:hypothetical protein